MLSLWPGVIAATNKKFKTCFSEIEDTLVFLKGEFKTAKAITRQLPPGTVSFVSINRKFREIGIPVSSRGGPNHIRTFPIDMKKFFRAARFANLTSKQMSQILRALNIRLTPEAVRLQILNNHPELLMEKGGEKHRKLWRASCPQTHKGKGEPKMRQTRRASPMAFPALAANTIQGVDLGRSSL